MELPDNTSGWKAEWFHIENQKLELPMCTGHGPAKVSEWDMQLTSREVEDLEGLLTDLKTLKLAGLTGGAVVISFSRRLIQPIKDRVHPAYEYWGQTDPTREANQKVSKEEMVTRVTQLFSGVIRNKTCRRRTRWFVQPIR